MFNDDPKFFSQARCDAWMFGAVAGMAYVAIGAAIHAYVGLALFVGQLLCLAMQVREGRKPFHPRYTYGAPRNAPE